MVLENAVLLFFLGPEKPPIQSSYLWNLQGMGAGDSQ